LLSIQVRFEPDSHCGGSFQPFLEALHDSEVMNRPDLHTVIVSMTSANKGSFR